MSDEDDFYATEADKPVLVWVKDGVGDRLLAYLLGCEESALAALISGDTTPTSEQLDTMTAFANLREALPADMRNDEITAQAMIVHFLAQAAPGSPSEATSMRQRVVGGEIPLSGQDDMERALIALAVDAYPACLLPISPILSPEIQNYGPSMGTWLFRHPQSKVRIQDPNRLRVSR